MITVRMRMGGISTKNINAYITSTIEISKIFKANKISGDEYKNALEFLSDKYYHLFHKFGRENIYYAIKDILNSIDQDSLANSPLVGFRESKINEKIDE